jgi:putative serine protease PepD
MNQTPRVSRADSQIPGRSALPLLGALLLGGSIVVAACGTSVISSEVPTTSASPTLPPSSSPAIAGALQADLVDVVNRVSPSVVVIETKTGLGSGVVFDASGDIVTNAHVVAGSTTFTVTLADGRKVDGTLVGTDPSGDLAVIHVAATGLRPATFGDSSKLVVGDIVLAVGNPLGLQASVTEGIVSALSRTVAESSSVNLPDVIQTSAAINPGNSGGALVDLAGEVVGIPTLTALDPQLGDTAAPGIGFAIASNTVVDIAGRLIASHQETGPTSSESSATSR